MSSRPTVPQAIVDAILARLVSVHVSIPGRVESYNASTRKASVKPLIKEAALDEAGNRVTTSLPVITDVPVVLPGSGGTRLKFDVGVGDTVLLVFADKSLDRWLVRGGEIDPADDRSHTLSDAIAIPGLQDFASAGDADAYVEITDSSIDVVCNGTVKLGSALATEAAIKGTTYRAAEDILLTAIGTFATSVGAAVPGQAAAATTLNTAIGLFQGLAASFLATKVKVE